MTAPSPNELVREFHETYDAPINEGTPTLDFQRLRMRYDLVAEEFVELTEAIYGDLPAHNISEAIKRHVAVADYYSEGPRDVVATADALADLVYVIYGFALEAGIPLDDVLQEVQRSNLSKLPPCEDCDGKGFDNASTVIDEENFTLDINFCSSCEGTGDGPPLRRSDGKILKGPNFSEPDIRSVLARKKPANA